MVVYREQEGLLGVRWPPLVNGTVVLPEFADVGATEAAINPRLASQRGHKVGVVGLDVGLDRRAGPDPATEPLQLICDELVVGRILKREELDEKAMNLGGPNRALVSAAGLWSEGGRHAQPSGAQLVEPRATHSQMGGSGESVERSGIEVGEDVADKFDGKTMDELLVFIAGTLPLLANDSNDSGGPQHHPITWSQPGRRPSLRSGLRPGYPLQSTFAPSPIRFCSGSVRFCSGPDSEYPLTRTMPSATPH